MRKIGFLFVFIVCLFPSFASATTYYIGTNGNDGNAGTVQASPWRTIGHASQVMAAGDTGIVLNGSYVEGEIAFQTNNGTSGAPITLKAQNKWLAIVSSISSCNPAISLYADYVTIQDMRFSVNPANVTCGYSSANVAVRGWDGHAGAHLIGNLVDFSDARSIGLKVNQDFGIIENNEVHASIEFFNVNSGIMRNNLLYSGSLNGDGVMIFTKGGTRNALIYNNLLHMTTGYGGIMIGGVSGCCWFDLNSHIENYNSIAYDNVVLNETGGTNASAFLFWGASDSAFINNVSIGGATMDLELGSDPCCPPQPTVTNPTFRNNIFVGTGGQATAGSFNYAGTLTLDHNDFFNYGFIPTQTNGISSNPNFVNNNTDWHLQSGSPSLTGGIFTAPAKFGGGNHNLQTDYAGSLRPGSGVWAQGIYTAAAVGGVPVNTALPTISGNPQVGQTLTLAHGGWTNPPITSYANQWKANNVNIAGATGLTYAPVVGDVGKTITVSETATNATGTSAQVISAATSPVSAAGAHTTWYVGPAGSDSTGNGTTGNPWLNIAKASQSALPGDTVILKNGTYPNYVSQVITGGGTAANPVTYQAESACTGLPFGAPSCSVNIQSLSTGCNPGFYVAATYVTFTGFEIGTSATSPCASYTSLNAVIRLWATGLSNPVPSRPSSGNTNVIIDNVYVDATNQTTRSEGIKTSADNTIVRNSIVYVSIEGFNADNTQFYNNLVFPDGGSVAPNNNEPAIFIKGGSRNAQIYNNIVHVQYDAGIAIMLGGSAGCCWYDAGVTIVTNAASIPGEVNITSATKSFTSALAGTQTVVPSMAVYDLTNPAATNNNQYINLVTGTGPYTFRMNVGANATIGAGDTILFMQNPDNTTPGFQLVGTHIEGYNLIAYNNIVVNDLTTNRAGGLINSGCSNCGFYNNTLIGGSMIGDLQGGFAGYGQSSPLNAVWINNIFHQGNAANVFGGAFFGYGSSVPAEVTTNNDWFNYTSTPGGAGQITTNPNFVSIPSNLHLQAGSPALGAGTFQSPAKYGGGTFNIQTDPGGIVRPNSGAWDLGAYSTVAVVGVPVNSSLPAISGTPQVGQTLTLTRGGWTNSPTSFTDQWKSGATNVGTGTLTYVPVAGDIGNTITVVETATNATGTSTPATSAATAAVTSPIPVNTAVPTISGTAQVGQTLTLTRGTWTNSPTSFADQWTANNVNIAGATGLTYVPVVGDIGKQIRVVETATNTGGTSAPATSGATAAVIAAGGVPVVTAVPTIAGTAQVGQTLTLTHGTWTNSPTSYADQWKANNVNIAGATGLTYVPVAGDVGKTITVTETATNGTGNSAPATSAATAAVIAATAPTASLSAAPTTIAAGGTSTLTWSSTNATSCAGTGFTASATSGSAPVTPASTTTYTITCTGPGGTAVANATVTVTVNPDLIATSLTYNAATGIFTSIIKNQGTGPSPAIDIGVSYWVDGIYQTWGSFVGGNLAAGASTTIGSNGGAYIIPNGAPTIMVIVDDNGLIAESNEANNTLSVPIVVARPVNTSIPIINGVAKVGQVLTLVNGQWTNCPTSFTDHWQANGVDIPGATGLTYTPVVGDIGSTITVVETATDSDGTSPSATSNPTLPVAAAASSGGRNILLLGVGGN